MQVCGFSSGMLQEKSPHASFFVVYDTLYHKKTHQFGVILVFSRIIVMSCDTFWLECISAAYLYKFTLISVVLLNLDWFSRGEWLSISEPFSQLGDLVHHRMIGSYINIVLSKAETIKVSILVEFHGEWTVFTEWGPLGALQKAPMVPILFRITHFHA